MDYKAKELIMKEDKIEIEELKAWQYLPDRLLDILNKEYNLEEAIEDIKSFRKSKWYTGTRDEFIIK